MSIRLGRLVISEPTLQKILDFLPYPFLVSETKDGMRLNSFVNKKFREEIGYTPEEMPTIHDWFLLAYPDPIYRSMVEELWEKRLQDAKAKGEDAVSLQVRIRNKKGIERWYEIKASLADTEMVAFIDIHDTKTREENLKKLNSNRDRILSILGHDLRGPLMHMHTLSKMAMAGQISQTDFQKMIEEVNRKSFQSLEFLSTTLAWAKTNFDSIAVKPEPVAVRKIISELLEQYGEVMELKKLSLEISVDPKLIVKTDREILTTVLRNLISNAIKFSFENGSLYISAQPFNGHHILNVKDTGMGIEEDKIQLIKSHHQHTSIGTYGEKGLGIGLILCLDLLKHIQSQLDIESTVGKGTSMKLKLSSL